MVLQFSSLGQIKDLGMMILDSVDVVAHIKHHGFESAVEQFDLGLAKPPVEDVDDFIRQVLDEGA